MLPWMDPRKILTHAPQLDTIAAGGVPAPITVELDLTNRCNHNCSWCMYATYRQRRHVDLPYEALERLIQDLSTLPLPPTITICGGGEPTIYPRFSDVLKLIARLNLTCALVSNGDWCESLTQYIAQACSYVRLSVDAGNYEEHARLHGSTGYPRIIAHARDLSKSCVVGLTVVQVEANLGCVDALVDQLAGSSVQYIQVRPDMNASDKVPLIAEMERLDRTDYPIPIITPTSLPRAMECRVTPLVAVIGATGELYPCCMYRGGSWIIGNILNERFDAIWGSADHKRILARLSLLQCDQCRLAGYNYVFEQYIAGDGCHRGFL